jgi:hypothetical protein
MSCDVLSLQLSVRATFCPCNHLSMRRFFCNHLSATFCPQRYVHDILSCNVLSCDILSMRHFVHATFCPRHFVLRHSVRSPISEIQLLVQYKQHIIPLFIIFFFFFILFLVIVLNKDKKKDKNT